ncbi:MAG: von Willebrand factor type A domain-containing protein [Chitinophagales bacterium]
MKKIVFMLIPLFIIMLAFNPVNPFTVHGIVKDANGTPIPYATVAEKGTKNAIQADLSGAFTIQVKSEKATLVISAVGYASKEIKLKGQSNPDIALNLSQANLEEVVVTGDRKELKKDITGFVSTVPNNQVSQSYLYKKTRGVAINTPYNQFPKNNNNGYYHRNKKNDFNTEGYDEITENPFLKVSDNPLSTFSIDVDAASYSNVRRFLNDGELPPAGAVRIEEMINYFHYDYPRPTGEDPFSVNTEISDCPWNKNHKLVLIGLQGKKISTENLPASNLVFLIDVSGSMWEEDKLPLVKASMKLLVDQLREEDKVALVAYAGNAGLVLPSTSGSEKTKIKDAIDNLEAGGSTAGGEGIKLAYEIAKENFVKKGNNRVILCTDGDFNVGVSSDDELDRLIEDERKSGVFLTVLGYGTGNYQDSKMQKLADKGNGNHAYIDGLSEAKKVLVNEFGGTLFTIAKDVKLQIEFNPARVQGYRLIGYEKRLLNKEDFNDDKKDAGELGSGHTVTALYEIVPASVEDSFLRKVDDLRYQKNKTGLSRASGNGEIMNIKLRYKQPDGEVSKLIEHPVFDSELALAATSNNFRFAAAVAEFGMLLRQSEYKSNSSFGNVINLAKNSKGNDEEGYRNEFIKLVSNAQSLAKRKNFKQDEGDEIVRKNY